MLDVAQVSNIIDYFVQSSLLLYGRRVDLDLEDAHREVCPPVCRVQVVLSVIRHVQVRPESINILWNKGRSHEKKLLDLGEAEAWIQNEIKSNKRSFGL